MRRGVLALAVIVAVAGCSDRDEVPRAGSLPPGAVPGIALQRIGTVGDYPDPVGDPLVLNVDAESLLTVDGELLGPDDLDSLLRDRVDGRRLDAPASPSELDVVLRLDRTLSWHVAHSLMESCAHPDVRIGNIFFAVLPEDGGEEGALATHLPVDAGLPSRYTSRTWDDIRVRMREQGEGANPAVLYERLKVLLARDPALPCEVRADALVPVGDVLRVVDVLYRAGVREIHFRGDFRPPPSEMITRLVPPGREKTVTPSIYLAGERLSAGADEMPVLPPVSRVRGGLAGTVRRQAPNGRLELVVEDPEVDIPSIRYWPGRNHSEPDSDIPFEAPREASLPPVDLAFEWLEDHQSADGRWDADGFDACCRLNRCGGKGHAAQDTGVTGLALLAFLGAKQTPMNGRYRYPVKIGLEYLARIQDADGCFGSRADERFIYGHVCATLAMVRAYALTEHPRLRGLAQRGLDFAVGRRSPGLAWRYGERSGDSDTSVTAWMVLLLECARRAELRVPKGAVEGARAWLDRVTDPDTGRVGYTKRGNGPDRRASLRGIFPPDRSEAPTAMGIVARVFAGEDPAKSEMIRSGVNLCLARLPNRDPAEGSIDMVYWFFGTIGMRRVGGESWQTWRPRMEAAIVDHQRRNDDEAGSWDPVGAWGLAGGRVYATALMAMCLQVCERYRGALGAWR
jgi:hypothetical protein